jgi:tRNA dimethylallyltransferase
VIPAETLIIAGPTGAGKTALSLRLAARLGEVEIVGADAFQLYAGLPLLTAQPTPAERQNIPHHLIDSIDPLESFDAGRYQRTAEPILRAIVSRGRNPLVVGGTGLYLKALLGGLDELPGSDPALRSELAVLDLPTLVERLRQADAEAPGQIDLANRRRVERALEIVLLTGKPLAASRIQRAGIQKSEVGNASSSVPPHLPSPISYPPNGVRALLVTREREELNARIEANVRAMFDHGVEAEVAALPEEKVGPTAAMTLGLREIRSLLRGEISRPGAMEAITVATRRYAKRQMTWFRNQHAFPILNLTDFPDPDQAVEQALQLLIL